jgi:hypothetical protein
MKIAFCGDSFCANVDNINYSTYPYLLALQGADIILNGTSGNPLYHSYMSLLEVIDKADYIVFCITEPGRLANKELLPICYGSVAENFPLTIDGKPWSEFFSIPESELIKVMQSARNYYLYVMSHEFHDMAQKGILMQIDELMIQKQKKCIWFPCFDYSMQGYIPKSGPIADTDLRRISKLELKWLSLQEQIDIETEDPRPNHFNEENNRNMARLIIDIINKDDFTPKEIKMKDYFKVLR